MPERASIFEVGPRDGLQNEPRLIPAADKIRLIDMLSACGFEKIEAASFVSPKWTPQMADAEAVMAGVTRAPGVSYAALTPNLKGYQRARAAGVDEAALTASASEGFSQKNINCSIAESLEMFRPVAEAARADGAPLRGYISCVIACPYDGPTPPGDVARTAEKLLAMGCYEISLGDTIGAGTPETVDAVLDAVLQAAPAEKLAGHYHDTGGRAQANIDASLERGLRVFDAAAGGLGGCPYAPGAKGNAASEAVHELLTKRGFDTGINAARLAEAAVCAKSLRSAP